MGPCPGGVGTSPPVFSWPCPALGRGLGQMPGKVWHMKAICKNAITVTLCLPGICQNKSVKDDEVLMDTALVGPRTARW